VTSPPGRLTHGCHHFPSKVNGLMAFNGGLMGYYGGFFWDLMGILMDTWLVVST
jgi:hypothetical protein